MSMSDSGLSGGFQAVEAIRGHGQHEGVAGRHGFRKGGWQLRAHHSAGSPGRGETRVRTGGQKTRVETIRHGTPDFLRIAVLL